MKPNTKSYRPQCIYYFLNRDKLTHNYIITFHICYMKFCLYSTKQTQAVHMATKYGDFVK